MCNKAQTNASKSDKVIENNHKNADHEITPLKSGEKATLSSLISIIVPVYNVEAYLHKCIGSLISQTYSNIEILLVDDGSTDSSGNIADEYAQKDKRVHVIHKQNGGVSSARNAALRVCKGEYILFVDSDDWICSNTCESVLRAMVANDADVCFYNLIMAPENAKSYLRRKDAPQGVCDSYTLIKETLQNYYLCINNKCFRRDAVMVDDNIMEFDCNTRILEDGLWLIGTSHLWKKGVMINKGLGYRRLWSGSALGDTEKRNQTNIEYLKTFQRIMPMFELYGEEITECAKEHFMAFSMDSIRSVTRRKDRAWLKAIVSEMKKVDEDYVVYVIANLYDRVYAAEKAAKKNIDLPIQNNSILSKIKRKLKKILKKQ